MAAATNLAAQSTNPQQTFSVSDHETAGVVAKNDDKTASTEMDAARLICQNTASLTSEDRPSSDVKADKNAASVQAKEWESNASLTSQNATRKQSQAEDNLASYMRYKQQVFRQ